MPAVRLVFLVALVVGVLAAIAASTTSTRTDDRTGANAVPNVPSLDEGRTVRATVPRKGPLVVAVGDTVDLTVTLPEAGRVVIDELGVHENVGPNLPTPVPFTATTAGTFDLKVQTTGKSVLRIVVRPARESSEQDGGGSGGAQPQAVPADEPRPV